MITIYCDYTSQTIGRRPGKKEKMKPHAGMDQNQNLGPMKYHVRAY